MKIRFYLQKRVGFNVGAERICRMEILNKHQANTVNSNNSEADEILKFKSLLDQGIITEDEFAIRKKQILGL